MPLVSRRVGCPSLTRLVKEMGRPHKEDFTRIHLSADRLCEAVGNCCSQSAEWRWEPPALPEGSWRTVSGPPFRAYLCDECKETVLRPRGEGYRPHRLSQWLAMERAW